MTRINLSTKPSPFLKRDRPFIWAHRGTALCPENTLSGFEEALRKGADGLELDVWMTKDGELVVSHSNELSECTDGKGLITEMTCEEVCNFDAGYQWSKENDEFPFRSKGYSVPRLNEFLQTFPGAVLNIDIKDPNPKASEELANELVKQDRFSTTLVGSFHQRQVNLFRKLCPNGNTIFSSAETVIFFTKSLLGIQASNHSHHKTIEMPYKYLKKVTSINPQFIAKAQNKGINFHVWLVNDLHTLEEVSRLNIDGIFTDRPDLIKAHFGTS